VLLAGGLAVAVVTGLVPLALGEPFLSGTVVGTSIVGREIKVATSLIFDVGVMSIVLGMVGTFVVALGQER
jgi:multicomponent Na+:H+ antiporter subunit B